MTDIEQRAREAGTIGAPDRWEYSSNADLKHAQGLIEKGYLAAARTEGIRRAIEEIESLAADLCVCHRIVVEGGEVVHPHCPLHATLSRLRAESEEE